MSGWLAWVAVCRELGMPAGGGGQHGVRLSRQLPGARGGVSCVAGVFECFRPGQPPGSGAEKWLEEQVPGLAGEIYFYQDPQTGTPVGEHWREALRQASSRCEAVICLVSPHWLESG